MGHDVVSVVARRRRPRPRPRPRCAGLPGSSGSSTEPDALALYVENGAGSIAEIVRRLERDQIGVGAISVARPTLDDVFLQGHRPAARGRSSRRRTRRR